MELPDALAWLDAHVNLEVHGAPPGRRSTAPTLRRIEGLVELLGSPQLEYPAVHVTGTNGKTSAARIASELLVGAGLSTGAYTSPHLERLNERMTWNAVPIDDDTLAELCAHLALVEAHLPEVPSWFELVTAAALRWFADVAVDVAVVEVGLGGTWDATNVVQAPVAVVTNVSVDHVELLGPDPVGIATEKAGIVDAGAALVLGVADPDLAAPFLARDPGTVWRRGADFGVRTNSLAHGGRLLDLYTPGAVYEEVFLPLHGAHQADNAAAALAAAQAFLGTPLERDVVVDGFGRARSPGRLEVLGHKPLVLLDGAHNVAGARALVRALDEEFGAGPRVLVVGLLREKEPREMLEAFAARSARAVVCCRAPSPRAHDPARVADAALELGLDPDAVMVTDTVDEALERALDVASPAEQVVVTGSLYTVGAARALFHRS